MCHGFEQGFLQASSVILEPIILVEVETPNEYVGIQGDLSSRRGLLLGSQTMQCYSVISLEVPLQQMFGYSTHWRSLSLGMASLTIFAEYRQVPASLQQQLIAEALQGKNM